MKTLFASLALLMMSAFFAGTAQAAPAGPVTNQPALESQLTLVASYKCRRDYRGWHFLRGKRRFACQPHRSRNRYVRSWRWRVENNTGVTTSAVNNANTAGTTAGRRYADGNANSAMSGFAAFLTSLNIQPKQRITP